jgi:hypothetical protein
MRVVMGNWSGNRQDLALLKSWATWGDMARIGEGLKAPRRLGVPHEA